MSGAAPMRALVVGFVESIHAVRAVEPMTALGWDVHVFASHPHWANPAWRDVTLHVDPGFVPADPDPSVRVEFLRPPPGDEEAVIEGLSWGQRVGALAAKAGELRPGLIDSMEIQHGGYLVLEARALMGAEPPPWLVHNWGSDVFYYGRNPRHLERLRGVLGGCDFYGAECHRDVGLARAFGFSGKALPVLPNAGGFDLARAGELRREGPSSARRTIALKAANTFVYRPETALAAIESCADLLAGYTLALYTASADVEQRARDLAQRSGFGLEVVSGAEAQASHEEILALHGRSRASIALSRSDAICTSFLEAMLMGSLPIQSDTGCSDAWAEDGRGALFVDPDDPEAVAAALRRALTDDALVDDAATANAAVAAERLDRRLLLTRAMDAYERVAAEIDAGSAAAGTAGLDPEAMAARLGELAADCGCGAGRQRRELLALLYLGPGEPPAVAAAAATLPAEASQEEWAALAADLRWLAARQAECRWGESVGWAEGEVAAAEQVVGPYDSELLERDAHIAALRRHVAEMQGSLDGFHRDLEAAAAKPPPARRAARLLPRRVRAWARRRAHRPGGG